MSWREMTTTEHHLAWVWFGLVMASIALIPLWTAAAPLLQPCPFRSVTSIPCFTCGATRGVLALMEGRIVDAVAFNPLIAATAVTFLVGGLLVPLWSRIVGTIPRIEVPIPRWTRVAIVLLILTNWFWIMVTQ
jgi:hypothetical protein